MRVISFVAGLLLAFFIFGFFLFMYGRGYFSPPASETALAVEFNPFIRSDDEILGKWSTNKQALKLLNDNTFNYQISGRVVKGHWTRQDFDLSLKGDSDDCCNTMRFVKLHNQYFLLTDPPDFSEVEGQQWIDDAMTTALKKEQDADRTDALTVTDPFAELHTPLPRKFDVSPASVEIMYLAFTVQEGDVAALDKLKSKADQGNAEAQHLMGWLYERGKGAVTQDYAEALKWYLKAAAQGECEAQKIVNEMYYHGRGVTKDTVEAKKWLLKAEENGCAFTKRQTAPNQSSINEQ